MSVVRLTDIFFVEGERVGAGGRDWVEDPGVAERERGERHRQFYNLRMQNVAITRPRMKTV